MPASALDTQRLAQALALAENAIGLSDPNPRVGCVIGTEDGQVLGLGHTQRAGEAHAEVMALRDAVTNGVQVHGATAWVTLEPCAHQGRTPPCCDALVAAGLRRVVYAIQDPNPLVAGNGAARMRQAGLDVLEAGGEAARMSRELNIGFFSRMERKRPWVRLKVAASLDGATALHNGASQWITGEAARADGHHWRKRAGAVMTGVGTVLSDDPGLDVRAVSTATPPIKVILDSALRMPASARLLSTPGRTLVLTTAGHDMARRLALEASGAQVINAGPVGGRVDLPAALRHLVDVPVNELHVEAGATLSTEWLRLGLVDELLIYLAPRLLGTGGRTFAALGPFDRLDQAMELQFTDVRLVGPDLRVLARSSVSRPKR